MMLQFISQVLHDKTTDGRRYSRNLVHRQTQSSILRTDLENIICKLDTWPLARTPRLRTTEQRPPIQSPLLPSSRRRGGQGPAKARAENGRRRATEGTVVLYVTIATCFQCLAYSNLTICSPLNPFCSDIFPTFSLLYWEANSYYPRGPIMGKGISPNFKIG